MSYKRTIRKKTRPDLADRAESTGLRSSAPGNSRDDTGVPIDTDAYRSEAAERPSSPGVLDRVLAGIAVRRGPVGLALGGGGARGIAHVGVLEALHRYPCLRPRIVAGTSAGSVIAVLYAAGIPVPEIRSFSEELDWLSHVVRFTDILNVRGTSLAGLLPNTRLGDIVHERIGGRTFDEFPRDVAVTATDLRNRRRIIFTGHRGAERMHRGELEDYLPPRRGDLPGVETVIIPGVAVRTAVQASCAVPGVFRPVPVNGMHLVDGGLVDQTPVDLVRALGARFSIGVSLALAMLPPKITSPRHALSGTMGILGLMQLRRSLELADIGFQVSGIETRSAVRPHQLDLIDIARNDMERKITETFGLGWVKRRR